MFIPIPEGLSLPADADTKPFDLSGKFILANGKLLPLMLGGSKVAMSEGESESEDEGPEQEAESEDGMEHGEDCNCPDCSGKKKGNGFMVAIETAMRPKMK